MMQRMDRQNAGLAATWTRYRQPVDLVYFEEFSNLGLASRAAVKRWSEKPADHSLKKIAFAVDSRSSHSTPQ
jgi:predicted GIY-YIG superfamily endonuclease